jgi:hypothetical protein
MLANTNRRRSLTLVTKLWIASVLLLLLKASIPFAIADSDILYVSDSAQPPLSADNSAVKRFNANTGQPVGGGNSAGVFFAPVGLGVPGSGGLYGPRGLFAESNSLFVVNQNQDLPKAGEILRYRRNDGVFETALVPSTNPDAPFAPRGMVSWRGVIYVADFNPDAPSGRLLAFDKKTGKFLREFSPPNGFAYTFHPRGLVIGPNGLLYVSNFPDLVTQNGGQVLVFDPETLDFVGAFIVDPGGTGSLNRPEGLVFGPDGNLYITSFRNFADPEKDTDSIRIYDGHTGAFKGKIDLYAIGQPRAPAQALLFGPDGKLFVPITGNDLTTLGQVRRYDVATKTFNLLVPAGGGLVGPTYLTFGKTDPGTLAYDENDDHGDNGDNTHARGGNVLPPTERQKGYSLSDIAKATAFFATRGPGDPDETSDPSDPSSGRSELNEPNVPFQILYDSNINKPHNTFLVQPDTMLYVPIFLVTDSPEIAGNFPPNVDDPKAIEEYIFNKKELGAQSLEIEVDGRITSIKKNSGYLVGVAVSPLADGNGNHYITAAVFLTPLTKGTHTVTIRAKFTGDAVGGSFEFEFPYTVIVN